MESRKEPVLQGMAKKLKLQRQFQSEVVRPVRGQPNPDAVSSFDVADARTRFLAEAGRRTLVLVDFPADRPGTKSPLQLVQEEDRRRAKI